MQGKAATRPNAWLLEFASNVYSQTGEDGVLSKILEILPDRDAWCVEFGAWDGRYLSNACNLIENAGYSAVLIEGDKKRCRKLAKNFRGNRRVFPINDFVGFSEDANLDTILRGTPIPSNFDFLSIDIDGNDYHVWKRVTEYRPKVVCIEFNPSIPTEVDFVQAADPAVNQGCGLRPLVFLGKEKGYELVSVLPHNAIFVRSEYFPLFEIADNKPETLRTSTTWVTHIFTGYDGTVFLRGARVLPWHRVKMTESRMQVLPKRRRRYRAGLSLKSRIGKAVRSVLKPDQRQALRRLVERYLYRS
jgi:hypothetical protein